MSIPENATILIEHAESAGDFKLRLTFNDKTDKIVDFGPFLRNSRNPQIHAFLDPTRFNEFSIKDGDLVWGDYDLCFPIGDLYEGHV